MQGVQDPGKGDRLPVNHFNLQFPKRLATNG